MKIANQKYTSIKNDFCLVFDKNAEIIEVPEDESIQDTCGFNFIPIKDIALMEKNRVVDLIAIVHSVG